MTPGRRPKPTARRRLEGNPGKRAYNAHEPVLPTASAEIDTPPAVIDGDTTACVEWRRLAPILRRARLLTDADVNALIAYCQQWSIYQDALVNAPQVRRVFKSPNDYPVINPYLSIANKALAFCDRIGEQLGLTPGGRARVSAAPGEDDAFAEFDAPRPTVTRATAPGARPH